MDLGQILGSFILLITITSYTTSTTSTTPSSISSTTSSTQACSCLHLKDLRDLTPLYPVVRRKVANIVSTWRKVEARIGVGKEMKFSLISINLLGNM